MSSVPVENVLTVEAQCSRLGFSASTRSPNVFNVRNKNGPLGSVPTVFTGFCDLPPNGKKESNIRGINTFIGRGDIPFSKLKLSITEDNSPDVINMCRKALEAWNVSYSPVKRSNWYQTQFKLGDGTKVHLATGALENPALYLEYKFDGPDTYNSPSSSFANALYGPESDVPWYVSASIPVLKEGSFNEKSVRNSCLTLYDENMKRIKTKSSDGSFVYSSTGIPLTDTAALSKLATSTFFQGSRWKCKVALQLSSIEWKTSIDINNGARVIYPVFSLRTVGSVVMMKSEYVLPEGVIPLDQRDAILDAALFAGLEPPSKKRKRTITPGVKKKMADDVSEDFEQEIIVDSDIEGEEDTK